MGARAGLALKVLQWLIRAVQFLCAAVILALFSYFLAVASRHHFSIPKWWRAVEGISGAAVLYTLLGLLLLCCLAGFLFTSGIAFLLDIAFLGAFIYIAQANRGGARSCSGNVSTIFGTRPASDLLGHNLPTFRQLCLMQKAVLAVSIIAIPFFLLSAILEIVLIRHRRKEARFGPSPANNYTSGYGRRGGFLNRFRRRKGSDEQAIHPNGNSNPLPQQQPPTSQAYTRYNHDGAYKQNGSNMAYDGRTSYPDRASYPASGQQFGDVGYVR
ncbi:hypothetical protein GGS21DRAFT_534037 [Xylaria nigripes]|nr:hypothetical protein GGS21DRAFT_534037 [Xylaria nigripes]